jgi:type IV pilus assembly protein PilP
MNRHSALTVSPIFWALLILTTITLLSGCGREMRDLQDYAEEVKSREPPGIDPIPEVKPYQRFNYQANDARNPFDATIFQAKIVQNIREKTSNISPDSNRTPEFLENFPLDTLRMVGTLEQKGSLWALVQTPERTIQRISKGNYLGQNNGKVLDVSDTGIELEEIIPDGFGGWRKRDGSIVLSE